MALLEKAIGLTVDPNTGETMAARQFAMQVLNIDERTLRRYISPDPALRRRIPGPVLAMAKSIIATNGQAAHAAAADPREAERKALEAKLATLTDVQREVYGALDHVGVRADNLATGIGRHVTAVRQALKTLKVAGLAEGEPGAEWRRV